MKSLLVAMALGVSAVAHGSGFECEGEGYRVKMYNQVQPALGTKNPAVLVVSTVKHGTVAVLKGDEITKRMTDSTIRFSGSAVSKLNGADLSIVLQVSKAARSSGPWASTHFARLILEDESDAETFKLACNYYLKN